jgi:hypothetical protein
VAREARGGFVRGESRAVVGVRVLALVVGVLAVQIDQRGMRQVEGEEKR